MSEKHANRALCPEDTQTPHLLETEKHRIPQDPLSETGALIRASRHIHTFLENLIDHSKK
jgi:hypothetical protein